MGFRAEAAVLTDSSAAKQTALRGGVGKVRHLDTHSLWIQAQTLAGHFAVRKVAGTENLADSGTIKAHAEERLKTLMRLNCLESFDVGVCRIALSRPARKEKSFWATSAAPSVCCKRLFVWIGDTWL